MINARQGAHLFAQKCWDFNCNSFDDIFEVYIHLWTDLQNGTQNKQLLMGFLSLSLSHNNLLNS